MALGHGSGFIKSWPALRLSPASLCPLQQGYCCWRQGSSPLRAGLEALGRWGPSESGRQTVRLAERGAEMQSQTERPPWKTPPPGGAALGTRPHPCCHSSGERIPADPRLHPCLSVRPAVVPAHRFRGESKSGAGGGEGPKSGAGVVGWQLVCGAATGCMLGPDPHFHHHCRATSSSAAGREPVGGRTRGRRHGSYLGRKLFTILMMIMITFLPLAQNKQHFTTSTSNEEQLVQFSHTLDFLSVRKTDP